MMALAQRAFGTRPQTDPWGNPAGTDSYEEWYAQELARQKQEALMSQVQRQQPYYGPEGYTPGGVGPGGLGSNSFPSGGTAIPPAFGSYFRGWGENAPQQVEPEPNFTPRPDDREPIGTERPQPAPNEKHIDVTRPVVIQASSVRTATQARDTLRAADKNTIVLDGMSDFGFLSDKVIIVPGKGDSAIDPQKVLDATSPPVLTQGMAAKMLKYLASVVPNEAPQGKKKTEDKPWWTLPYQAYTAGSEPETRLPGVMGKIHNAIDPVQALGGYGAVASMAMPVGSPEGNPLNVAADVANPNSPAYKAVVGTKPRTLINKQQWTDYINSSQYADRFKEMYAKGNAVMQGSENPNWWPMQGTGFERVYGSEELPTVAGITASTSPNATPRQNIQIASEIMRRHLRGEPLSQSGFRVPEDAMGGASSPGKKLMETAWRKNLERIEAGHPELLERNKVFEMYNALMGDENAVVLDRHFAKLSEDPAQGIFTGKETNTMPHGKLYEANKAVITNLANELHETPANASAKAWVGIRETLKEGGDFYGQPIKSPPKGPSYSLGQVFEEVLADKAAHLGITVPQLEVLLRKGSASLLSFVMAAPLGVALFKRMMGSQEQRPGA